MTTTPDVRARRDAALPTASTSPSPTPSSTAKTDDSAAIPVQSPPESLVATRRTAGPAVTPVAPPNSSFPPPNVAPPFPRTAAPGDGVWEAIADGARDGRPLMVRTKLHVHHVRSDKTIAVVAVDRAAVEPVLVVGRSEPPMPSVPAERRTGLVPVEDHGRVLGVFNGGFMQKHGKWGMVVGGDVYTPLREDACSIVSYRDGRLRIGTHAALGPVSDVAWVRQTPPCLVEGGVVNERVVREPGHVIWGKAVDGKFDIRRSAVALDSSGRILYFVFSDWNNPSELAQALVALGANAAAELDVNWSYTWFYWIDRKTGAAPRLRESLVPKTKFDPRWFLERPAERDFFYL
ncbi:MAG: hypothetical protein FJ096_20565, partial [Deltaproteobacteria bacterium]|nr:hypothetical protein [Deltaproteobacteria bacterium]